MSEYISYKRPIFYQVFFLPTSYSSIKFKSNVIIHIMNKLYYGKIIWREKIQPSCILVNTIFALTFSSSAIEIMACYYSYTCLKNSACLMIVYSFPYFFPLTCWQVSESFMWDISKDFTMPISTNDYFNLQKPLLKQTKRNNKTLNNP